MFVNITAADDTAWHRGLTSTLMHLLPDRHIVAMIMELVRNNSFILAICSGKLSALRRLKNGVPQESVLALLLIDIYTYNLPVTIVKKFAYSDDLAILLSTSNWQALKETLTQDMAALFSDLHKWKLKLSIT